MEEINYNKLTKKQKLVPFHDIFLENDIEKESQDNKPDYISQTFKLNRKDNSQLIKSNYSYFKSNVFSILDNPISNQILGGINQRTSIEQIHPLNSNWQYFKEEPQELQNSEIQTLKSIIYYLKYRLIETKVYSTNKNVGYNRTKIVLIAPNKLECSKLTSQATKWILNGISNKPSETTKSGNIQNQDVQENRVINSNEEDEKCFINFRVDIVNKEQDFDDDFLSLDQFEYSIKFYNKLSKSDVIIGTILSIKEEIDKNGKDWLSSVEIVAYFKYGELLFQNLSYLKDIIQSLNNEVINSDQITSDINRINNVFLDNKIMHFRTDIFLLDKEQNLREFNDYCFNKKQLKLYENYSSRNIIDYHRNKILNRKSEVELILINFINKMKFSDTMKKQFDEKLYDNIDNFIKIYEDKSEVGRSVIVISDYLLFLKIKNEQKNIKTSSKNLTFLDEYSTETKIHKFKDFWEYDIDNNLKRKIEKINLKKNSKNSKRILKTNTEEKEEIQGRVLICTERLLFVRRLAFPRNINLLIFFGVPKCSNIYEKLVNNFYKHSQNSHINKIQHQTIFKYESIELKHYLNEQNYNSIINEKKKLLLDHKTYVI